MRLCSQSDVWRWNLEEDGAFTVESAYNNLEGLVLGEVLWSEEEKWVFEKLWKNPAPSKVVAFTWKAFLNRIPSKVNLAVRNILDPGEPLTCVLCNRIDESALHLLLHCEVASVVWLRLMRWLDRFFILPPNLFIHWECWNGGESNKNVRKGLGLIWLATIWTLWKTRNDMIFNDDNFAVDVIVERVKVLAWRWILSRMNIPYFLNGVGILNGAFVGRL